MWEYQGGTGKPQVIKTKANGWMYKDRCFICGQYVKKDEEAYIIYISTECRTNKMPNMDKNKFVHKEHWDMFCKDISSDKDMALKMTTHTIPRKKSFTEEELKRIKAFEEASRAYGFRQTFKKPFGLKTKKPGTSVTLTYNVYYHHIDIDYRGRKGLFGGMWLNQISANVWNKTNELLGLSERDDFSASKIIQEATQKVNEIMGN